MIPPLLAGLKETFPTTTGADEDSPRRAAHNKYLRTPMPSDLTIPSYLVYYRGVAVHTFDSTPAFSKDEPAIRTMHFGGLTTCGHHRAEDIGWQFYIINERTVRQ